MSAVKEQLDKGTSLDDVIARLASSLATSVAAQLGISPQAAAQRLTSVFTQALQPSGSGPPGTNAERASSLVTTLRHVAEAATRVANGDQGQPILTIAGQSSDAEQAKANPAPDPDRILRDALAALAAPASPAASQGAAATAVSAATAAASDGRTVALDSPALAVATGGDTPLGRILARSIQSSSNGASGSSPLALRQAGGDVRQVQGDDAGASSPSSLTLRQAQGGDVAVAAPSASDTAALDAFVSAFATAIAHGEAKRDAAAPANAAGSVSASADASVQAAASLGASPIHDAAPVAPPVPASALPQPQHVDANAVVDQLLRGVAVHTTDGSSQVRLRLTPESLGDVSVKLVVSGGAVDATITAHTPEAQSALAGAQSQLAKSFADSGLKLQSFSVGLAGGGFADARDQSHSNASWTRSSSRRIGGVGQAQDETDDASLFATPSFGPPIYSARSLPGAFNHLA